MIHRNGCGNSGLYILFNVFINYYSYDSLPEINLIWEKCEST